MVFHTHAMCALSKFSPWGARESLAPQILFLALKVLVWGAGLFLVGGLGGRPVCRFRQDAPWGSPTRVEGQQQEVWNSLESYEEL